MKAAERILFLIGRSLLGLYFILPGIMKVTGFSGTAEYMAAHGMIFAGGQAHLAGGIVRIAHLGWMDDYDALVAVASLERALVEMGAAAPSGAAVQAAQVALST